MKWLALGKIIFSLHPLYGYNFRDVGAAGSNPVIPTLPAFISAEAGGYLK